MSIAMMNSLTQIYVLTIASLKMYYRNKQAIFFSIVIPIFIILIFGAIFQNSTQQFDLAIVDNAHTSASSSLISTFKTTKAFKITQGSYAAEYTQLNEGNVDLILEIPQGFTLNPTNTSTLTGLFNQEQAQNAQTAFLIINNILAQYNDSIYTHISGHTVPAYIHLQEKGIQTNNLGAIDFLIPGIIAFSIMQTGIFNVAFAFTTMKKTGALKRLQATPAKPLNFILSQAISRLILSLLQVGILLTIGIQFFHLHMYGSLIAFFIFVLLGSIIFLSIGFAIAGYSKDENQVAPIANVISLPMTFLSGVFFSRSLMPPFLSNLTQYFPLTYLADALRQIANNGVSILQLKGDLLGLLIWAIIAMIIAVKLFKWE